MLAGSLELDLLNQRLCRGTQSIALTPKAFGVLRLLVEHAHRLVTKEALLNSVWPGARVEEGQVKQFVSELRRLLQDEARKPHYIETVHGRGYRWIGEITVRCGTHGDAASPASAGTAHCATVSSIIGAEPICFGREADFVLLEQRFAKAVSCSRQMCLVSGEPGIGKTTLIGAFVHRIAARQAFWLLRGQCSQQPAVNAEPYFPLLEALDNACYAPEGKALLALLRQYAPLGLTAMPGHLSADESLQLHRLTEGLGQERRLREYSTFFETLSLQQPVVLWLEDLHWADPATLALLSHLARSPRPARLFVIASVRPKEMYASNSALHLLVSDARSRRVGIEIELPPMNEQSVCQYVQLRLAENVDSRLGHGIFSATEGHPLFVSAMTHAVDMDVALARKVADDPQTAFAERVPDTLREIVEQALGALGEEERNLLEAASIAGRQFSAAEVAAALKIDVEQVEHRCEQLFQQRLFLGRVGVSEWPDGTLAGEYRFLHNLCFRAVYLNVPPSRRARLQNLISKHIEQMHPDELLLRNVAFNLHLAGNGSGEPARTDAATEENLHNLRRQ